MADYLGWNVQMLSWSFYLSQPVLSSGFRQSEKQQYHIPRKKPIRNPASYHTKIYLPSSPLLLYIMQVVERRKTVTVSPEIHRRIVALRQGKQTFGDVIAESIRALEEKKQIVTLPHYEDLDLDKLEEEERLADQDFENNYISLEDCMKEYERTHRKT